MIVCDIETDGLLDELTKIHVLSWKHESDIEVSHTFDYDEMRKFLREADVIIGHDFHSFDLRALKKVLGQETKAIIVDTLVLSWYLYFDRKKHGLESYGEDYGVPKPKVDDWKGLTPEEYAHRCDEDVKINALLWKDLKSKLHKMYPPKDGDPMFGGLSEDAWKLINYLSFKMKCAADQSDMRWELDLERCQSEYDKILKFKDEKTDQLSKAMPKSITTKVKTAPALMKTKNGEMSVRGAQWVELCKEHKVPATTQSLTVIVKEELGNPGSNIQVKDWLYSLGWKPRTFKYSKDKHSGAIKRIEQIRDEGELCESVKELATVDPSISILDGLTILTHRAGILKSFLDCAEVEGDSCGICSGSGGQNVDTVDGEVFQNCLFCGGEGIVNKRAYVKAEVAGLTNTFRFKHMKPLVNLPGVDKEYGDVIRGVLIAPEGYCLLGADKVSLEDTTKRHYMQPYDPDYVADMCKEGFDPHLDLAKFAGEVSQEGIDAYNLGKRPDLKSIRKDFKVVNYSATYGISPKTLARNSGMSLKQAEKLLKAFWDRNYAIKKVSDNVRVKEMFGSMWLKNPVSGFWHSLRSDKDRFSTLNQSTGVYCFDTWVYYCKKQGLDIVGQFHDEIIALVKLGDEDLSEDILIKAAAKLNEHVKLNVELKVDWKFGSNYAEIH